MVKNPPVCVGDEREHRFDPWTGKISWRRKWQPTPVFLPGKSHGQRSLAGYSPWGRKESGTTECAHTDTPTHIERDRDCRNNGQVTKDSHICTHPSV